MRGMSLRSIFLVPALLVFLMMSCMEDDPKPDNLIPMKEMKKILTDIHYADAYAFQEFRADTIYRAAAGMYLEIFEKYGVDTAAFNSSFNYYVQHPKLMDNMYAAMIDSLNARESRIRE